MENNPNNANEGKKPPRKRVKKEESGQRNFKCEICQKEYLSHPALYTHYKKKHNKKIKTEKPKGRPKNNSEKDNKLYDPKKPDFFLHEKRKGKTPTENINNIAKRAFIIIYEENKEKVMKIKKEEKMKIYNNIEEHPFLGRFINEAHIDEFIDKNDIIDNVLILYLNHIAKICNENYYEKLIVFITLFREYINIFHKTSNNKEYTTIKNAQDVPDMCNEFINEFLFPDENKINFGLEKQEVIDLTTNLCSWMYTHDFTDLKIYLYEGDEEEENNENENNDNLNILI